MNKFLKQLLEYYNVTEEEYIQKLKDPNFEDIFSFSFFNVKASSELVKKHINESNKILIYGDYDCDGILATTILKKAFNNIKYPNVGYYIPRRSLDGYGITNENIKKFKEYGYKLIILVDNGITLVDQVDLIHELGIEVIICDHHELGEKLPNTPYIIHPYLSDKKYCICSGGFTAYVLAREIENLDDEYLFTLAGITIVSDMMEIIDYNKDAVKLALKFINQNKYRQVMLLAEDELIDETTISFKIVPKINSIGRIINDYSINNIVAYFLEEDNLKMNQLYRFIIATNENRRQLSDISNYQDKDYSSLNVIIDIFDVNEGIVGLIAARFQEKYQKPVFAFTTSMEDDSILKGSCRSKDGINILDIFAEAKEYIIKAGGHANAGGLSIYKKDFNAFKNKVEEFLKDSSFIESKKEKAILITANDINEENYRIIRTFAPFGVGNSEPIFRINDFPVASFDYSRDKKHIVTRISKKTSLIQFNFEQEILNKNYVTLEGKMKESFFKGFISFNFMINKIY